MALVFLTALVFLIPAAFFGILTKLVELGRVSFYIERVCSYPQIEIYVLNLVYDWLFISASQ